MFVYVANAEDGDIGMYTLQADGSLRSGQRFKAAKLDVAVRVSEVGGQRQSQS